MGFDMTANKLSVVIEAQTRQFQKEIQKVINKFRTLSKTAIQSTATVTKAFKIMKTTINRLDIGDTLEESLNKAIESVTSDEAFDRLLAEIGLVGNETAESARRARESFRLLVADVVSLQIGKKIRESIEPELKSIEKEDLIGKISEKIKGIGASAQNTAKMVSNAVKTIRKSLILLTVLDVLKKSIETAVKASEMDRLFKRILGDYAEETYKWSKEVSKSLNILDTAVRKDTQVIYTMVNTLGIGEKTALKMSKGVAMLTQDMASFYDIDPATAFYKIQSGLTGIGVPLKELGIIIDDNIVKQTAYRNGLAKVGQELTTQQKVVARYMAIMEQTASAHGHLSRNLDTTSNKLRKFKAEMYEFLKVVGTILKPFVDAILDIFNVVMKVINAILKAVAWLFGFDIYAAIHKETEKIGDNANSIADGMGDAAENAKKLKKYLASFDEIENLNIGEQEDDETVGPILEVPNLEEYEFAVDVEESINNIKKGFSAVLTAVKNIVSDANPYDILLSDNEVTAWIDDYNDGIIKITASTDKFNEALSSTALIKDTLSGKLLFPEDTSNSPMLHTSYELSQNEESIESPILTYTENFLNSDTTKEWFEQYNEEIAKATESTEEFNEVVADNALLNNALNGGLLFPTDTSNSPTLKDASSDEKSSTSDSGEGQPELKGFAKIKDEVTKKWDEIKTTVTDKVKETKDKIEEKWEEVKTSTSTKWEDVKKQATEKWTVVKDTVVNNCTEAKDKVTTKWEEVKKGTTTKYEEIKTVATEKWTTIKKDVEDKVTEITDKIEEKWEGVKTTASTKWEEIKTAVTDKVTEAKSKIEEKWEEVKTATSTKWDEVKTAASTKWEEIKTAVADKVTETKDKIEDKWDGVKNAISTKWDGVKKEASTKWDDIKTVVADKVTETKSKIEEKWDGVKGIFGSLVTYLDNTFINDFGKPLAKITKAMENTKTSIVNTTKTMINWIIEGLNKMIRGINKIHIDIPEWLGGGTLGFNIPELPKLARGGIVSSPTIAMIGEAGKEAVVPLENNTEWIDKLASKIAVMLAAMRANEDNRPINVNVTTELNGKVVSKELIRDLNKEARRLGYKPLLAT